MPLNIMEGRKDVGNDRNYYFHLANLLKFVSVTELKSLHLEEGRKWCWVAYRAVTEEESHVRNGAWH